MATLVENAAEVANLASAIDTAITTKGGTLVGGGKLRNAAAGIASIQTGSTATPLTVINNGTYTAPTGSAYSPVTVNVPTTDTWDEDYFTIKYDCLSIIIASLTFSFDSGILRTTVDWGDGTTEQIVSGTMSHTYQTRGVYYIKIAFTSGYAYLGNNFNIVGITEMWMAKKQQIDYNRAYNQNCAPPYCKIHIPTSGILTTPWFSFGNHAWYSNRMIYLNAPNGISVYNQNDGMHINADITITSTSFVSPGRNQYSGNIRGLRFVYFTNCNEITLTGNCGTFSMCPNLIALVGITKITTTASAKWLFKNDTSLEYLPDTIDMTATTDATEMFLSCTALKKLPSNVTVNVSLSFAPCTGVTDADSVATFDANGNITGGFVYNLNTCTNTDQTITLNSTIKALFDSTQQTAIETAMTAKNWTLAW